MPNIETEKHIYDRVGGALSLDFANTLSNYLDKQTPTYDYLDSYTELFNFAQQMGIITPAQEKKYIATAKANPQVASAIGAKAKNLRTAIRLTLTSAGEGSAPDPEALSTFNSELAEAMAHAQVSLIDGAYQWTFQPSGNLESIL
ncbi:MAG: ABATE domain-containing protein, partial [Chloroflexia bacterium]